jgi:L-threonylcarbamoyladenylate synthase
MTETTLLATDDPQALPTAVQIVRRGGLIAFPTDTIYGVACDPTNPKAITKIYRMKKRCPS